MAPDLFKESNHVIPEKGWAQTFMAHKTALSWLWKWGVFKGKPPKLLNVSFEQVTVFLFFMSRTKVYA